MGRYVSTITRYLTSVSNFKFVLTDVRSESCGSAQRHTTFKPRRTAHRASTEPKGSVTERDRLQQSPLPHRPRTPRLLLHKRLLRLLVSRLHSHPPPHSPPIPRRKLSSSPHLRRRLVPILPRQKLSHPLERDQGWFSLRLPWRRHGVFVRLY